MWAGGSGWKRPRLSDPTDRHDVDYRHSTTDPLPSSSSASTQDGPPVTSTPPVDSQQDTAVTSKDLAELEARLSERIKSVNRRCNGMHDFMVSEADQARSRNLIIQNLDVSSTT